jgi:hypothetical protein
MCDVNWQALFGILKDIALALAAIVTPWVAWQGLQTWQRELRGKAYFDAARGLARATYKVREELAAARSPLLRGSEYPSDYDPSEYPQPNPEEEASALAYVYKNRWQPVQDALREFNIQLLEAEALWGPDIRHDSETLQRCATTVFVAFESMVDDARTNGEIFAADRNFARVVRSQAAASATATDNQLSNDIKAAVEALEARIRPHLARAQ